MDILKEQHETTNDGEYTITTIGDEIRMSHWVYAPEITDAQGKVCFSLRGSNCDLRSYQYANRCWLLKLCQYPNGLREIEVLLDFNQNIGFIDGVKHRSIDEIETILS
jgi:hypothetical protein